MFAPLPVSLESLVFGHVGLVVSSSGEAVTADLTDERFHRQVDLGVLAQVRLGGEACGTLGTHVRLCFVERRVSSIS